MSKIKPNRAKLSQVKPVRRKGKIAQLPKDLRDELNRLIQSGKPGRSILNFLADRGYPHITQDNLTNWIKGDRKDSSGYNDWLRHQHLLLAVQSCCEFAKEVASQNAAFDLQEAARLLAITKLTETLTRVDIEPLKQSFRDTPQVYPSLVTALRRFSRESLKQEQFTKKVKEQTPPSPPNSEKRTHLPPDVIAQCEAALHML